MRCLPNTGPALVGVAHCSVPTVYGFRPYLQYAPGVPIEMWRVPVSGATYAVKIGLGCSGTKYVGSSATPPWVPAGTIHWYLTASGTGFMLSARTRPPATPEQPPNFQQLEDPTKPGQWNPSFWLTQFPGDPINVPLSRWTSGPRAEFIDCTGIQTGQICSVWDGAFAAFCSIAAFGPHGANARGIGGGIHAETVFGDGRHMMSEVETTLGAMRWT